jgi:hypothetical protein
MVGTATILSHRSEFRGMRHECVAGETNRFHYRFWCHGAAPLLDYGLPGHTAGDLFQDVGDQYSRAAKDRLTVANLRVSHDKPTDSPNLHVFSIVNMPDRSNTRSQLAAGPKSGSSDFGHFEPDA